MYTTINGCRIYYEKRGQGQAVLLLHGWGQHSGMMDFIQADLQAQYCVLNVDLPGFGKSEEPPTSWDISEYALCMKNLMDELEMKEPILIAHSFGARIALRFASLYPCDKLVLTGAAGIRKKRTWQYYLRVYSYKIYKRLYPRNTMGSSDFQQASPIMRGVLVKSVEEDLRPLLKEIQNETLLIWGSEDMATPLWMGQVMEEEMGNATLVILQGDDHFAYYHQATRFLAILRYFL